MLKAIRNSYILTSLFYIVMGIVLLLYPESSLKIVCNVFGVLILLFGVIKVIGYFSDIREGYTFRPDLIIGVLFAVVGGFLLLQSEIVISIFPIVLGIYIVIDSFTNIRQAMDLKKAGYERWWNMLLLGLLMVLLAAVMIFNPFGTMAVTVMFIGGVFVFRGVSNLISAAFTERKIKKLKRFMEESGPVDVEAVVEEEDAQRRL